MATANINFVAQMANATPASTGKQTAMQSSEQSGQPSFSQVLQSRSEAQPAQPSSNQTAPSKDNPNNSDKPAQADSKAPSATDTKGQTSKSADKTDKADTSKSARGTDKPDDSAPAQTAQDALAQTGFVLPGLPLQTQSQTASTGGITPQDTATTAATTPAIIAVPTAAIATQAASTAAKSLSSDAKTDTQGKLLDDSPQDSLQGKQLAADAKDLKTELPTERPLDKLIANSTAKEKASSFAAELSNAQKDLGGNSAQQGTTSTTPVFQNAMNVQTARNEVSTRHEITTPVGSNAWADEVGQKVTWVANSDNGRAELVLTPAHMGRVEVSISMSGDQATANFVAASAATRDALQDAMPRLREVLAQAGIQLGQANVNANTNGQTQSDNSGRRNSSSRISGVSSNGLSGLDMTTGGARSSWISSGNGLVDTFA